MDRNGHKKIRKYLMMYLIFFVLFSVFLLALGKYQISMDRRKMFALMNEHPELEAEIIAVWEKPESRDLGDIRGAENEKMAEVLEEKYGYRDESFGLELSWRGFWAVGILAGALLTVAMAGMSSKKRRDSRENLKALYESLEQFRKGEFGDIPDYAADYREDSESWMKVWESLRELGVYFDDLKRTLKEEENRIKALITDISHQLKTPLASLRMSHELMTDRNLTEEERREFQEQEEKEIEKLETLLKELVNLSRMEDHMIQIRPLPASLKKTIAEAVSQIYVKARNKEIEIQVEMKEDLEVCHDVKWTEEAFVNILDNSVKYSREHTTVTVRVKRLVRNVLIEVEDEGIGIEKEELSRIYHRFYRGKSARKMEGEGAGVGLYLARLILERQGGTISAKQKSGEGTIFRITLPAVL